jgi:alcohol dehydrogenase class IV
MFKEFQFASTPHLHFGAGKLAVLPPIAKTFGSRLLLITGARSFLSSTHGENLMEDLRSSSLTVETFRITKEPSPQIIDEAVKKFGGHPPDCVIAIGGGSVLDAGKAISAMLPLRSPVKEYLEGVGSRPNHPGVKVPFIAVPTTSGTGSEATKNAVISEIGDAGYKRSLRHDNFVPNLAIVDPSLSVHCPAATTASSGMDAFTQLLESWLSTAANPMTDALAREGLKCISRSLLKVYEDGSNIEARTDMALASYLSGVTLANAGLGLVHGFASPIGGYFEIPHGVICSILMGPANQLTVRALRRRKENPEALKKYAEAGRIFSEMENKSDDYYIDSLLSTIEIWTKEMQIPRLSRYGVRCEHFEKIINGTGNKNNPISLNCDEMMEVLERSL